MLNFKTSERDVIALKLLLESYNTEEAEAI